MICPASREWTDNRPAILPAGQLSIIIKKKREHYLFFAISLSISAFETRPMDFPTIWPFFI
ncbi:hypothetical protein K250101E9_07500 [Enterocloster aldenensis]